MRRLKLHDNDLKIGWGKPSPVSPPVLLAVQQFGATRNVSFSLLIFRSLRVILLIQIPSIDNATLCFVYDQVYLGNLPETVTEQSLRDELSRFGPIDQVKIVRGSFILSLDVHLCSTIPCAD